MLSTILIFLVPFQSFASVYISTLLPNPAGKDEEGEYIEIRNTGCESVDISGYSLSDASGKNYPIPNGTILGQQENRRFPYSETNIQLNNSGDESVFLKDPGGNLVDEVHYSGTQKDAVVITFSLTDADCTVVEIPENTFTGEIIGTGTTDSGSTFSGEILTSSGVQDEENIGTGEISDVEENTNSGTISESGSNLSQTGTEIPMTDSGAILGDSDDSSQTNSGSIVFTGKLVATSLSYGDMDGDSFIETLFITYPEVLSGSVNTGGISLYSATGGLYEHRINTETGYILSGSLSGNVLIFSIIPSTIQKSKLKITNTTSSELRLKSSGDIGIRSVYGQELELFLLTSSFSDYRNIIHPEIPAEAVVSSEIEGGNNTPTETGSTEIIPFPDIIPTFQNYTNATFSGNLLTCTTSPCRVNFTLEPIFTGSFIEKDYTCQISYGTENYDTCNPPQLYLTGTGNIDVQLTHKNSGQTENISFLVEQKIPTSTSTSSQNTTIPVQNDANPPIAILEFDGKIKSYMDLVADNEMNCYSLTCAINLTAEKSYDPEGGSVRFLWIYGINEISTKKDPGERKYGLGDHRIELRVMDSAGNYASVFFQIHVLGPKIEEEKQKEQKPKKEKTKETLSASIKITEKTIKKINMQFFSPPEILLQGKTLTGGVNSFECLAAKTSCQINLTLTGTARTDTYEWILSNGTTFQGKNPKGWTLPIGKHSVELRIYKKGETTPYWSQIYGLEVKKKAPTKKKTPKKVTVPKTQKVKETSSSIIPETYASDGTDSQPTSSFGFLFIFGFGFLYMLRRRLYRVSGKDIG
ncbi:MAG: lamin tail domain-containing protein [Candidatus Gracilibacteria bacterium]|nr:lamin tail domain-containing protein [Candidatus Gracilibacteria bacterium]